MNEREFKESLDDFLNEKTYIVAYRSNYDSARDFNKELINYIKRREIERTALKSISNMQTELLGMLNEILDNELYENQKLKTEKEQLNSLVNSCQKEIRRLKKELQALKVSEEKWLEKSDK